MMVFWFVFKKEYVFFRSSCFGHKPEVPVQALPALASSFLGRLMGMMDL